MPASEAQIRANQQNALKSSGPKTAEGKERSRGNALKHGLTGEGVALANEDVAEVDRMFAALQAEMRPTGEVGRLLIRRAAIQAVRMERCVVQEAAALSERVLRAEAEADPEDRVEAGRRAMFDPSREACLARKYEASAERGFFKALKEFRQLESENQASPSTTKAVASPRELGSFLPEEKPRAVAAPATPKPSPTTPVQPAHPARPVAPASPMPQNRAPVGSFDRVPFSIGRVG